MGLILDSSVLIPAERRGLNARQALEQIAQQAAGEELAISVISATELAHGAARSNTQQRRHLRWQFINKLIGAVPVHPVTTAIALRAGLLDGECTTRGVRIVLSDLLIGVTALELGYKVATGNLRHFQLIPGLQVVSM